VADSECMAGRTTRWDSALATALAYPEAAQDFPWGETVVKIRKKIFVFLGDPRADSPTIGLKLRDSVDHARSIPGAEPMGYGLGRHGWTNVPIEETEPALIAEWIDESYRLIAPKTLVRGLSAEQPTPPAR
jgi:predicted DNA-binding protein (MmcQ/YjbR family)